MVDVPREMRAWQYTTRNKPFESNLSLNNVPILSVPAKGTQTKPCILVKVHATSVNPVDYKIATTPVIGALVNKKPATPCLDFAGTVAKLPAGISTTLKEGDQVFGRLDWIYQHGTLAEYALVIPNGIAALPPTASFVQGAALGTAAITAYQALEPYVKPGSRVFINGGSGGVGSFCVQIAKLLGAAHVTATCSGANEQRVRALGADEVIDYRTKNVLRELKRIGEGADEQFDHIVENVGEKNRIYEESHCYLREGGAYVQVAAPEENVLTAVTVLLSRRLRPAFLGGGKRTYVGYQAYNDLEAFERIAGWVADGKLEIPIDSEYAFEDAKEAFAKVSSNRAKGKVVVRVV